MDANGDIWSSGGKEVRCWRTQGLNEHGVPIYTQEPKETYAVPAPFTEVSHVIYDAELDRLFVGGFTKDRPKDTSDRGGSVGSILSGFADVRAGKGQVQPRRRAARGHLRSHQPAGHRARYGA